ncbi:MAG: fluoride efflux transporter CrcB [Cyanobacteriota bacterium]|nr:fluoride efflux transporter CrcB [Cyanobacteriota bacterium]
MRFDLVHLFQQSIEFFSVARPALFALLQQQKIRGPIAIATGAIAGSITRYYLGIWFLGKFGKTFPYGTLFINTTGCFAMGFFVTFALEGTTTIPPEIRLLIAVGFLGSYTTFSSYELESMSLLKQGNMLPAAVYWLGSAIVGIVSLQLGHILAKLIIKTNFF